MKKKTYQQPKMKVVKFEQTDIICTSQGVPSSQNESYDEGSVTDWFN